MQCPHCNKRVGESSTKCVHCQGRIRYTTIAKESRSQGADGKEIWLVQKIFGVIGAILFPLIYYWLFKDRTFEGYLWAIGYGGLMGLSAPYMTVARKDY